MWQKLNPVGIDDLENTRIHLHKAVQLVAAAARSYLSEHKDDQNALLEWVPKDKIIQSKPFGEEKDIYVSLDLEKFILSIRKAKKMKEHLVLSGMTYPLAFGWLQVKLDKFGLDAEQFDDQAPYKLTNYGFDHSKELQIHQKSADELTKHFSNAFDLFSEVKLENVKKSRISMRARTFDMGLELHGDTRMRIGFSPGDENYIEPYFYLARLDKMKPPDSLPDLNDGLWNNKDWFGALILTSDYMNLDPEKERSNVVHFFENAFPLLTNLAVK